MKQELEGILLLCRLSILGVPLGGPSYINHIGTKNHTYLTVLPTISSYSQGLRSAAGRASHLSCEGCGFNSHLNPEIFPLRLISELVYKCHRFDYLIKH